MIENPPRPRVPLLRRFAHDNAFVVSGLGLGVAGLVVVVTGVSLAAGLLVLWVGVPVLAGTLLAARGLAHVQRDQLRHRLHRAAPTPTYLRAAPGAGRVRRWLTPLQDPQSWFDAAWALLAFVTGTVAFVVVVTWWAVCLGGLTYWSWQQWLPEGGTTVAGLLGWGSDQRTESLLHLGIGVVATLLLPWVLRGCAALHGGVADVLLCSRARLQSDVQRVVDSRAAARGAEAQSLRRLERDLHDGPQQGVVRLALDISRARRQLTTDPDRAGRILDEALVRARGTTEELRALSRGIAPPLLVDRGLAAALGELLQRSPIPTTCTLDVPEDLPPHVETAVYFAVAEALTNVAKHSAAHRTALGVTVRDGHLVATVDDDGVGGAHVAKGSGLAGLQQRLAGVEGTLTVSSPTGGPTRLVASIPLPDNGNGNGSSDGNGKRG
ncbi:sensor domain-containing protein [Kineococcus aurantiacus]|uniref:histidine kinase n=1 Tax=Kineococcus aurantiacus TaxID=37633 RepID=A0A7Y9DN49_9ACTN|nr:signal transduction histidine kinase [Kineococcus aurantiacus]